MKVAIMQPYLFPYIGYFQLMNVVDEFVIYDNIQFSKKGWINRNRILVNGSDAYLTIPLKKDSDFLDIKDRYLSDDWYIERKKILNRIAESYKKAPQFSIIFPIIEKIVMFEEKNLFRFLLNSLTIIHDFLEIKTAFVISSTISIDHHLKSSEKVKAICKERNAKSYYNPIGGLELYDKADFKKMDLDLFFLKTDNIEYKQMDNDFVPFLSIIDVMMYNSLQDIKKQLASSYTLY